MLDGERLQNRGLSFLRRRRDKGELIEGVKPILSSWPQKGGLRACRRTDCHSLAARGPLRILTLDTELLLKPKMVFCSSLKMWPVFLSKVICQPPHFSLKPACGQRPWLLSPHSPTLYWARGSFSPLMEKQGLTAVICQTSLWVCNPGWAWRMPGSPAVSGSLLSSLPCPLKHNPCHPHIPFLTTAPPFCCNLFGFQAVPKPFF